MSEATRHKEEKGNKAVQLYLKMLEYIKCWGWMGVSKKRNHPTHQHQGACSLPLTFSEEQTACPWAGMRAFEGGLHKRVSEENKDIWVGFAPWDSLWCHLCEQILAACVSKLLPLHGILAQMRMLLILFCLVVFFFEEIESKISLLL